MFAKVPPTADGEGNHVDDYTGRRLLTGNRRTSFVLGHEVRAAVAADRVHENRVKVREKLRRRLVDELKARDGQLLKDIFKDAGARQGKVPFSLFKRELDLRGMTVVHQDSYGILQEIDLNGDGYISWDEMQHFLEQDQSVKSDIDLIIAIQTRQKQEGIRSGNLSARLEKLDKEKKGRKVPFVSRRLKPRSTTKRLVQHEARKVDLDYSNNDGHWTNHIGSQSTRLQPVSRPSSISINRPYTVRDPHSLMVETPFTNFDVIGNHHLLPTTFGDTKCLSPNLNTYPPPRRRRGQQLERKRWRRDAPRKSVPTRKGTSLRHSRTPRRPAQSRGSQLDKRPKDDSKLAQKNEKESSQTSRAASDSLSVLHRPIMAYSHNYTLAKAIRERALPTKVGRKGSTHVIAAPVKWTPIPRNTQVPSNQEVKQMLEAAMSS